MVNFCNQQLCIFDTGYQHCIFDTLETDSVSATLLNEQHVFETSDFETFDTRHQRHTLQIRSGSKDLVNSANIWFLFVHYIMMRLAISACIPLVWTFFELHRYALGTLYANGTGLPKSDTMSARCMRSVKVCCARGCFLLATQGPRKAKLCLLDPWSVWDACALGYFEWSFFWEFGICVLLDVWNMRGMECLLLVAARMLQRAALCLLDAWSVWMDVCKLVFFCLLTAQFFPRKYDAQGTRIFLTVVDLVWDIGRMYFGVEPFSYFAGGLPGSDTIKLSTK